MIVVADASVLVGELLRRRGRELLSRPDLRVVVAEHQWNETAHELDKRLAAIVRHGHLSSAQADGLLSAVTELVESHVIEIIPWTCVNSMDTGNSWQCQIPGIRSILRGKGGLSLSLGGRSRLPPGGGSRRP